MVANALPEHAGVIGRVLKVMRTLVGVHLEMAQAEASRDAGRMVEGVVLLATGVIALGAAGLCVNAGFAFALGTYTTLGWVGALGVVAAGDILFALTLFGLARRRLKTPVMKETRGLMKRTVSALREA